MLDAVTIQDVKLQIGKLCGQQMKIYKLSQEELADALGLSRYTIQKFETGKNATLDTALKIANHFDLLEIFYKELKEIESTSRLDSFY